MLNVLRRALGFPSFDDVILGRTPKHAALVTVSLILVAITAPGQAAVTITSEPVTVVVDAARSVSGTVDAGTTTVALQQKVSGSWRTVRTDTPSSDGSFALPLPTWFLGSRDYRVVSGNQQSDPTTLNVRPSYTPAGRASEYDYMVHSTTARWDPCGVIGWRINDRQATTGALRDLRTAFARLRQATGFRFVYRGTTNVIPQSDSFDSYPRDTQIVVAWVRRGQTSLFAGQPSNADAVGSPYYLMGYHNGDGSDAWKIAKGAVVIDSRVRIAAGYGTGLTRGDILLHELGHVMGLGHVDAGGEMMNPYLTRGVARYGRGDLNALEQHGAKMGCLFAGSGRATAAKVAASS